MASARCNSHLPAKPSDKAIERSQKYALQRDILHWFEERGLGWARCAAESTGSKFVAALTDILWYLDGHFTTFCSRGCPIPQSFQLFSGYNQPSKSKHRKRDPDNLSAAVLDSHSCILNEFALHPWLNSSSWKPVRADICVLADSLHKYAEYLKCKNSEVQENHNKLTPVRLPSDAEHFTFIRKSSWIKPAIEAEYRPLQIQLDREEQFVPVFVNDYTPADQRYAGSSIVDNLDMNLFGMLFFRRRRYYIDSLKNGQCLRCDTVLFAYSTGNCLGTIHFIWRVPEGNDVATLTAGNAECYRKIQPSLPTYHTRAMRKHFFDQVHLLQCGKASTLRGIYKLLTGESD